MYQRASRWFDRQNTVVQLAILGLLVFAIRTFVFGLYVVPTGSMETTMLVGERFVADKASPWVTSIRRGDIVSFNDPEYPYSKNSFVNVWQRYVYGPSNWTKRVIGLPGDHVVGKIEDGTPEIYINGKRIDEPYVNAYPLLAVWAGEGPIQSEDLFGSRAVDYKSYDPNKPLKKQPFYAIDPDRVIKHPNVRKTLQPGTPFPGDSRDTFDVKLGPNQYWVMGDNRLGSHDSRAWGALDGKQIHGKIRLCLFSVDYDGGWLIWKILRHPISFFSRVRWSRCMRFVR